MKCGGGCVAAVVFMIILLISMSIKQVDRLNVGLLKNGISGEVDLSQSYTAGRYMVGFWWDFIQVPTTLNTIEFSDELPEKGVQDLERIKARDKDGKMIYMDIAVQYRIKPERFTEIYRTMTTLFEDFYITDLRSGLQKASNAFRIAESWEKYSHVRALLKAECDRVLESKGAECWDLQLMGARLMAQYEDQLIRTQVQKQKNIKEEKLQMHKSYRAETRVVVSEFDKKKAVIDAQADAMKVNIERLARSKAEEAVVKAQGEVLKLVRDIVFLPNASGQPLKPMNDVELVQYQRILMLQGLKNANLALKSKGGSMKALSVP